MVKPPRWVFSLGAALTTVVALSFIAYWFLWAQAFNYADANKPVPSHLDVASNAAMTLCRMTSLAIVALAASTVVAKRRPRDLVEDVGQAVGVVGRSAGRDRVVPDRLVGR